MALGAGRISGTSGPFSDAAGAGDAEAVDEDDMNMLYIHLGIIDQQYSTP